jgi:hypothetical protein
MKITMITHRGIFGQDGMKKLLHVPTRPRTKLPRSKKISKSCLISFIKSLGLSKLGRVGGEDQKVEVFKGLLFLVL